MESGASGISDLARADRRMNGVSNVPGARMHNGSAAGMWGAVAVALLAACGGEPESNAAKQATLSSAVGVQGSVGPDSATIPAGPPSERLGPREPNNLGYIPVFEYHVITRSESEGKTEFHRTADEFRSDLAELYRRGYRPVTIPEILDKKVDEVIPRGYAAVALVFDDASPSQFRYIEKPDGSLEIDPNSAVGILQDFATKHPDWRNAGTFCLLSAAKAGRSFFGNNGIEGQKTEWRYRKIKFLVDQGYEICNHTQWHARLDKYPDRFVQEQIAKLQMAVDSAVPGYKIRTLALPLGIWPKNRTLARRGSWNDPKTGQTVSYNYHAVLEVAGGPNVSPYDPKFDPTSIDRVIAYKNAVGTTLDRLDTSGKAYVSDGDPKIVARQASKPGREGPR